MVLLFYTLYGFAIFFFGGWCFVWLLHIIAILNGKLKLHKKSQLPSPEVPLPGVSILKPLTGVDQNLYSNLESFFTMNYPKVMVYNLDLKTCQCHMAMMRFFCAREFELLFCIEDESDASIMLVKKLIEKHPEIDASVFIGGRRSWSDTSGGDKVGVNPKINNMNPGYEAAKYDLILVSDSGIRMKEDTLLEMVCAMTENVALVHQMPFTCDRGNFPSVMEKVYFGTSHARIYLAADLFRINCPTGMSALMRKKLLDEVGGIKAFGQYLAEDFFFAKSFTDRGWSIRISSQPAWQNSGICEITNFNNRISRWAKLRFAMVPYTIVLEPLSECMVLGACAAWALNVLFQWDVFVVYLVHILAWLILDWILLNVIQNNTLPFSKMDFVVAWTFREMGAFYHFCLALLDPKIQWRTRTFYLRWGGLAEEVSPRI